MAEDGEQRSRVRFTGMIELTLLNGSVGQFTGLELEREGAMKSTEGVFRITLQGPLAEVRRLEMFGPQFAAVIAFAANEEAHATAPLKLEAMPDVLAEMARAAAAMPTDALPNAWVEDPAWVKAAFDLARFTPVSIGIASSSDHG